MNIQKPWFGPLVAIAFADAYGCGGEFQPTFNKMASLNYRQHTMWPHLPAGYYSDDTLFTLALVEAILADQRYEDWLVKGYRRDCNRGCSPNMRDIMKASFKTGRLQVAKKGDTAGAAMRSTIFGLWPDVKTVLDYTTMQAELTHAGDGVLAAQATALMAYFMRARCKKEVLRRTLYKVLGDERFDPKNRGTKPVKPGNKGMECVLAALWLLETSHTLSQILLGAINLGGDCDTVAVIAMGAAWASEEYFHDLPMEMWTGLENGRYGRDYLRDVEDRLLYKLCPWQGLRCD